MWASTAKKLPVCLRTSGCCGTSRSTLAGTGGFVDAYDAGLDPVTTDSYSPNNDTNLYDQINGLSYSFDDNQNETFDPTTEMHKAYDYLGRLVAEDRDSGLTEPEKRYRYDVFSRLSVEEINFKASWHNHHTHFFSFCPNCAGGGCGNPGQIEDGQTTHVTGHTGPFQIREFTVGVGISDGERGGCFWVPCERMFGGGICRKVGVCKPWCSLYLPNADGVGGY
jgi:hypothetical protein